MQPVSLPPVPPDPSAYMGAWIIWGFMFIGTFLMTFIGTWLITRGWKE
jgi:hypothetical protein